MVNLGGFRDPYNNNPNNRPRIRSADFEQENGDWLRHTMERHSNRSQNDETWNRSMDRRRAHSMPRKARVNSAYIV